ncbi:MAG: hypothetical protein Q8P22_04550, partial [Chloroflexota bacterium]|nr:hypothetical protein [Chloroflexota bacterium]
MRKLFSVHKRTIGLGLMGALVAALALLGGLLWANQPASAQPTGGVDILHVNPDGLDYAGNPYCPGTIWADGVPVTVDVTDDCNNITSQNHVIRTEGWVPWNAAAGTGMNEFDPLGWDIAVPGVGNNVAEGRCGDLAEVTGRIGWNPANDDEECVVIHSSWPGETRVTKSYEECVLAGDPPTIDCAIFTTGGIVKEWDSLVDSVILKEPDLQPDWGDAGGVNPPREGDEADPADFDGDTDVDADDHHDADRQGTWENDDVVFDEATKRIRSADGPIQLVEIVHGEHDVLINSDTITLHHPTEGAIFLATIDSTRGCTYFTDPSGFWDFGDAMNGISTGGGRFLGPHTAPAVTQPIWLSLNPDSHNGTAPQGDADFLDIWVDTTCEEQATIVIDAGYPDTPGSLRLPTHEEISINWVTIELAKQPVIRWAGEEIVLEKRWALPDMWFPNGDVNGDDLITAPEDVCPLATNYDADGDGDWSDWDDLVAQGHVIDTDGDTILDTILDYEVDYLRLDPSPGGLKGQYVDNNGDGYLDQLDTDEDDEGEVDLMCQSKALYDNEDQGKVEVEASLLEEREVCPTGWEPAAPPTPPDTWRGWGCAVGTQFTNNLINKHAFWVLYLKIYQVKLTNTDPGDDGVGRADHNAGVWEEDLLDPSTDTDEPETLNVSADALLRVTVKGWLEMSDKTGRGAVCVDMDGDGDGNDTTTEEHGVPYPLTQYEQGCPDANDEIIDHGHWVFPDDFVMLAGGDLDSRIPTWDVMDDPGDDTSDYPAYVIGLKSTLDSHDLIPRANVACTDPYCPRKTIVPDGELTISDAILPPLKITAQIEDPADAGFLREANKVVDLALDNAYSSIMIPYEPEIPWMVNNGGYDWDSWYCRSEYISGPDDPDGVCTDFGLNLGPYEFYDVLNILPAPGPLENTDLGNQDGQTADDPTHPRKFEFYTDNRGEGFFFANGDYNLDFGLDSPDGCVVQALYGTPDCEPGDIVGNSTIQVNADYPYFRQWPSLDSNPV